MARIHEDLSDSSHHPSPASWPSCDSSSPRGVRAKDRFPKIAVIGAGIAGLRCADILIQGGCQVTIYEAQDGIGGRTRQASVDGRLLDLGANFIHGTNGNAIAEIAYKTGTAVYPLDSTVIIDSEGKKLDLTLTEDLMETWEELQKAAYRHSEDALDSIDQSLSLLDYLKQQIPLIEADPKKQALLLDLAHTWGCYTGESIDRQSLKFAWLEKCIEGDTPFVADTYEKIVAEIAAPALVNAKIFLNEEVTFIDTHMEPSDTKNEAGVKICTRNGILETYDQVVLTAPLGWLKEHKYDVFASPLPPKIVRAIENISFSRLEKVYLTFSEAWWEDTPSPSNPFPTPYAAMTHFLNPSYAPHPDGIPWNQTMVNLAAIRPSDSSQPRTATLLFYLYGDCSAHFLSLFPPETPFKPINMTSPLYGAILTFFTPFLAHLPRWSPRSPTNTLCHPLSILPTAHSTSPFSRGSYTHIRANTGAHIDSDLMALREYGGEESGLWLAGEHTAPWITIGTTTGAYSSGEAVGERILKEYGIVVGSEGQEEEEGSGEE